MFERDRTPKQAILPEQFERPTLAKMVEGESYYTVPWAMWVDKQRNCWLHPEFTVHEEPGGTVEMQVSKTSEGYVVDITTIERDEDKGWQPVDAPGYVSPDDTEWIPVVRLIS